MGILNLIGGFFSLLGSGIKGFFTVKNNQAELISKGIDVIGNVTATAAEREKAAALVIAAEASSGSWLAVNWRPITMLIFVGLIVARFFGLVPSHMALTEYERLWDLMELGMGGYIAGRTVEKIINQLSLGTILKKYLDSKVDLSKE